MFIYTSETYSSGILIFNNLKIILLMSYNIPTYFLTSDIH